MDDTTEIAIKHDESLAASQGSSLKTPRADDAFSQMVALANKPDFDADKLKTLAELQIQLLDRRKEEDFRSALHEAKEHYPIITKDNKIIVRDQVRSHFATLENIRKIADPVLRKFGLSVGFNLGTDDRGRPTVQPYMDHVGGYREYGGVQSYPIDKSGSMNDVQGVGSTNSYGMRYQYCAITGIRIDGQDNDAQTVNIAPPPSDAHGDSLLKQGEEVSAKGVKAYETWYKALPVADRNWLYDKKSAEHEGFKAAGKAADEEYARKFEGEQ